MNISKTVRQLLLLLLIAGKIAVSGRAYAQPGVSVPIDVFYNELAPYGQWMQYPGYGDVWLPNAGPNFQPYATAGHWVMTDYGNTWVSDYPWGWAPFHYGRWMYDSAYGGWLWIPGPDWAPAWVDWRSGGGYYGWAPLGPNWGGAIPAPFWTFVPQVYITSPNVYSYYVPRPNIVNIYQRTTIINNVYQSNNWAYNYGPPRRDIERITRQPVQIYRIDRLDRPGRTVIGNGSVGFYRPNGGGQSYGRPDRYDNGNRGRYNGYGSDNRSGYYGNNTPDRTYPDNNRPGRDYNSSPTPNPGYGGNRNVDRGGSGTTAPPTLGSPNSGFGSPANPANPQPERTWGSRGSYAPGGSQPGGFSQAPSPQPQSQPNNRPFEPMGRGGAITPQAAPGNVGGSQGGWSPQRSDGPMGGSRSQAPAQAQPQPSGNEPFGGGRGSGGRGPR